MRFYFGLDNPCAAESKIWGYAGACSNNRILLNFMQRAWACDGLGLPSHLRQAISRSVYCYKLNFAGI